MKSRGIVVALLFVISVNALTLQHIYRLPILVSHFLEHKEKNPNVTFFGYLAMHYWADDGGDNDQNRHMQLPFKKAFFYQSSIVLFFQNGVVFTINIFSGKEFPEQFYTAKFITTSLDSLFRPPRLV